MSTNRSAKLNASAKRVYLFGAGRTDGTADMKDLLGGKGANLAEMASLGLPVPPGFTITTEVCTAYNANGRSIAGRLEGRRRGGARRDRHGRRRHASAIVNSPLLVSVRSGARASMPGMMDTILNLGLNDETVKGLAAKSGNARFAYDSYRRFIQMYADVVLGVDHGVFEDILDNHKNLNGFSLDTDLSADDWQEVIAEYQAAVERETGKPFPQDTAEQLWGAIGAVFGSWQNERAKTYRRLHGIPDGWGTAVNVQAMVFGNLGQSSATGVAFTRNPSTGAREIYGEFLVNAQGEDVVAGIRTPQPLTEAARKEAGEKLPSLQKLMPDTFGQLEHVFANLERRYRDMQDIEFTIQDGKLWMLQTRSGKRTTKAALKIAADLVAESLIDEEEAVLRVDAGGLDQLLHPTIDPAAEKPVVAMGLPASPGAASGEIVFDADEAETLKGQGREVILVRIETSPEDIHGMHAAAGILTARGGMTSHAAVVARGMGRPCVCGAGSLRIDAKAGTMTVGGETFRKGDIITIDGSKGEVLKGRVKMRQPGAVGRLRHHHGLGRQGADARRARQRRHAARGEPGARVRRRGHRAMPHRAHVLRGEPHPRHARDDLRRRRGRPPPGARQDAAHAARRLRGPVRDHGRPAGDHPPARSAAARVPAARGEGGSRRRQGAGRAVAEAAGPRLRAARVQPDAGIPRLPPCHPLSRDHRDAGARHLRGGRQRRQEDRQAGDAGGDDPADRLPHRVRPPARRHRQDGAGRREGDGRQARLPDRHHDRAAARRTEGRTRSPQARPARSSSRSAPTT